MKRRTTALASLVLSVSILLTGCSNDTTTNNDGSSNSQSQVSESEIKAVSETVNNYYNGLIEKSPEAMEASDDVEKVIREVAGDKTYEAFSSSNNPFIGFDNISDEQAKELADRIQELNPIAEQFDYSQMNDRDRAVLNLLNIASSIMLTNAQDKTVQISIPSTAITVEGNSAYIPYSSMTFIIEESQSPMRDALGGTNFYAVKVNGVWKVDGQKTYESTRDNALGTQPSDAGGNSDNGEG